MTRPAPTATTIPAPPRVPHGIAALLVALLWLCLAPGLAHALPEELPEKWDIGGTWVMPGVWNFDNHCYDRFTHCRLNTLAMRSNDRFTLVVVDEKTGLIDVPTSPVPVPAVELTYHGIYTHHYGTYYSLPHHSGRGVTTRPCSIHPITYELKGKLLLLLGSGRVSVQLDGDAVGTPWAEGTSIHLSNNNAENNLSTLR